MQKIALLLLLWCMSAQANAQSKAIVDSLKHNLSVNTHNDTNRIKNLYDLSYACYTIVPDEGLRYARQALAMAQQQKWEKGIASSYTMLGINYEAISDHKQALNNYFKALASYEKQKSSKGIASVYANVSLVYQALGDHTNALDYAFRSLHLYEDLDDKRTIAMIQENIGSLYFERKSYKKTRQYYTSALQSYRMLYDTASEARCLGNIGMVLDAQGAYKEALSYHQRALSINRRQGYVRTEQINIENIGYVYSHMHDYPRALEYQKLALAMSRQQKAGSSIAINMGNLGETYYAMATDTLQEAGTGKKLYLDRAIHYLSDAIDICTKISFTGPLMEFEQYLSDAYQANNNSKEALAHYKHYVALHDSVFSLEHKVRIAQLETDRQLKLRDKQIQIERLQLKNKSNERKLFYTGIALLCLVTGVVLRLWLIYRKSNRVLLREKKALLTRIEIQVERIKEQSDMLDDIAHTQSHDIRGPVATILGLSQLFNPDNPEDPTNKVIMQGITSIAEKLDSVVKDIVNRENSL